MENRKTKKEWFRHHKGKIVVSVFLVLILSLSIGIGIRVRLKQEEALKEKEQPRTVLAERRTLISSISATGIIASAESKEIAASISGLEITTIPVEVGQIVEAGTVLCEFDTKDIRENLQDAQNALSASSEKRELDLSAAQRSLAEAQTASAIEQERMNQDVADAWHNYLLAVTDAEEAEEDWEKAKETAGDKEAELEHRINLHAQAKEAGVSGNELIAFQEEEASWYTKVNTARQQESNAKAAYEQAKAEMENRLNTYEKQLRSQEDSLRSNESAIASKTENLNSLQITAATSTDSEEKKVEEYQKQLDKSILKSPIKGLVTAVSANQGDVYNGGTLFTIEDISSYEVSAEIDEYDIGKIQEGQEVVIKTNGTGELELRGRVKQIAPRATKSASQGNSDVTYNVRIAIDTPNDLLKLDMTAKLSIILDSKENVLTVPYEAIQQDEEGKFFVEVEKELSHEADQEQRETESQQAGMEETTKEAEINESVKERIYIKKGIESDYYVEIISNSLKEGMEVIVPKAESEGMDIQMMMMEQGPMGGF